MKSKGTIKIIDVAKIIKSKLFNNDAREQYILCISMAATMT